MRAAPRRSSHDAALRVGRAAGEALLRDARSRYADFPLTPGDSAPQRGTILRFLLSLARATVPQINSHCSPCSSTSPTRAGGCAAIRYPPGPSRWRLISGVPRLFFFFNVQHIRYDTIKAIRKRIMIIAITARREERYRSFLAKLVSLILLIRDRRGYRGCSVSSSGLTNTGNSAKEMIVSGRCSAAIVSKIQS